MDKWWHRVGSDLRVMREITWLRLDLRYVWRDAAGTVFQEGRKRITRLGRVRGFSRDPRYRRCDLVDNRRGALRPFPKNSFPIEVEFSI